MTKRDRNGPCVYFLFRCYSEPDLARMLVRLSRMDLRNLELIGAERSEKVEFLEICDLEPIE